VLRDKSSEDLTRTEMFKIIKDIVLKHVKRFSYQAEEANMP
jgi:hypothetical protein